MRERLWAGKLWEVNGMLSKEMREELIWGLTDIFRNNITMIILYGSAARGGNGRK